MSDRKLKPIKFIKKVNADGKFYYTIESSNGNNLSPGDPQKKKGAVTSAIGSLINHIQAGAYEISDETKPVKKKR